MNKSLLGILAAGLMVAACGGDEKKPPTAPTGGTDEPSAQGKKAAGGGNEKPGDNPSQSQINISDEIKKACGITDVDAHFAFDSANVREQDHKVLGQLATCFTSGPLAGREMRLVGHADPRGEPEYNMVLGGKRADNVKGFIAKKGMNADKIATTSRGEMDATGTEEASWLKDRRVDVVLGD
ncbi:MAG: OmpA family protein [Polyangiaceae bacterium]|nr:OmpA family protein [Polyangiaceae bacterium]